MMQNPSSTLRMQDLKEGPYEKALRCGVLCLSDEELLAILIRSGTREKNALALAYEVMQAKNAGLCNVEELSLKELTAIRGLGTVKALTLKAACELGRRITMEGKRQKIKLDDPSSVASYFMEQMRHEAVEKVLLAFFDNHCGFLSEHLLSIGTEDRSFVSLRLIFREALRENASYFILLHNHPSGDPCPSREDRMITERICKAGDMLEIPLADHIIIGDRRYYSFKEHGELLPREGTDL
ncbi:RadC family protein [Lachnospiraceae bacterium YH-ros2228]|nr:DNA repair protein RadC [Lachnospiraceae bacterium]MDD6450817.1 DNA repair protein RadC [Lachnospiraceae bacterium]MDD6579226.1 DNA repair protein RadC [Lachnospiraceae bacterium]